MMTKQGSTKNITFIMPGSGVHMLGCGHTSQIMKMRYFFKNRLLYSQAYIKQTMYIVMVTKEGSTENVVNMYYLPLYQYTAHCSLLC